MLVIILKIKMICILIVNNYLLYKNTYELEVLDFFKIYLNITIYYLSWSEKNSMKFAILLISLH